MPRSIARPLLAAALAVALAPACERASRSAPTPAPPPVPTDAAPTDAAATDAAPLDAAPLPPPDPHLQSLHSYDVPGRIEIPPGFSVESFEGENGEVGARLQRKKLRIWVTITNFCEQDARAEKREPIPGGFIEQMHLGKFPDVEACVGISDVQAISCSGGLSLEERDVDTVYAICRTLYPDPIPADAGI